MFIVEGVSEQVYTMLLFKFAKAKDVKKNRKNTNKKHAPKVKYSTCHVGGQRQPIGLVQRQFPCTCP